MEVFYNNQWYKMCGDDEWDMNNAEVVCRELSFGRPTQVFNGLVRNRRWLINVNCVGTEMTIAQCSSDEWMLLRTNYLCRDAHLICAGKLIICLSLYVYIQLS